MANERIYSSGTGLKQVKKITTNITQLIYKDRESLCQALCRIEEHYESPKFKGQIFTLGQYRQWYSEFYGAWTYPMDWSGFNIPSQAFARFFDGSFDPLDESEKQVVDLFRHKQGDFCVIGTFEGCDADVYEHEICHALYALNAEYRAEVDALLGTYSASDLEPLKNFIVDTLGYNVSVATDEAHAYMCESSQYLKNKNISYPIELTDKLKEIKSRFVSK